MNEERGMNVKTPQEQESSQIVFFSMPYRLNPILSINSEIFNSNNILDIECEGQYLRMKQESYQAKASSQQSFHQKVRLDYGRFDGELSSSSSSYSYAAVCFVDVCASIQTFSNDTLMMLTGTKQY
ncbi:hypothetical protein BLOT_010278 [Blomia tropicalis]|nr:hypothetical protein BLOT_010278 [Blomia tropicalis]